MERSLLGILATFRDEGFTYDFRTRPGGIVECGRCHAPHPANTLELHHLERLEGDSDPPRCSQCARWRARRAASRARSCSRSAPSRRARTTRSSCSSTTPAAPEPAAPRNAPERGRVHRPVHVVAISGSLKQSSANSALVQALAELDPETIEVWGGLGELPHFTPDGDGGAPVESLRAAVAGADRVLLATPEYAGGMPGGAQERARLVGRQRRALRQGRRDRECGTESRARRERAALGRGDRGLPGQPRGGVVHRHPGRRPCGRVHPRRWRAQSRHPAGTARSAMIRSRNATSASRVAVPSSTSVMPSRRGITVISSPAPTSPSRTMRR